MEEAARAAKRELRERLKERRSSLDLALRTEADMLITAGVLSSQEYADCGLLLSYLSFGAEVDTHRIVRQALALGKDVALPRCEGRRTLGWYRIEGLGTEDGLVLSPQGMREPDPHCCTRLTPADWQGALALVPGLSFDVRGFRLGYGGGYYDSFLAGFAGRTMGLCREMELADDLAALGVVEPHDLPVETVMTDERILRR